MAKDSPPSFLAAFDQAGAADLTAINQEIDSLRKRLEGLEAAKKILEIRVNGKPPRKKPGPAPGGPGRGHKSDDKQKSRIRAAEYLLHSGTTKPEALANSIGLSPVQRLGVFDH